MTEGARVVMFAEDPGAANCFAPLALALDKARVPATLLAGGLAREVLRTRGLQPLELGDVAGIAAGWCRGAPDWLVVGTSENIESPAFALTSAARSAGIRTAALIDSAANTAHRFRGHGQDPLQHAPEWLLVPDAWTARQYMRLGHREDRIVAVGHPHYDFVRAEGARLAAVGRDVLRAHLLPDAGDRFVLVFLSEISTGLDPAQYQRSNEYTLAGRGTSTGRTEIIAEELIDAIARLTGSRERPWCVLRRHPKEPPGAFAHLLPSFDQVSIGGAPLELIFAADLVVGMTTMALAEAHLLGVPTLSILPRELERNWLPLISAGEIESATDRARLWQLLAERLSGVPGFRAPAPVSDQASSTDRIMEVLALQRVPA